MTNADLRRYPKSYFTREHLEPIETSRDIVLMRDGRRCIADASGRSPLGRCADSLVAASAVAAPLRHEHQRNPLFLRTFCIAHVDADLREPSLEAAWVYRGWRIPRWVEDLDTYALLLPVLGAGRSGWWLYDAWGERRPVAAEWAADLRGERFQ